MPVTYTEQGLLLAIRTEPRADDLRLVFADWCEENGQGERAEFIRVQVEMAKRNAWKTKDGETRYSYAPPNWTKEYEAVRRRERELFHSIKFPELVADGGGPLDALRLTRSELTACELPRKGLLCRGFVSEVSLPLEAWVGRECLRCRGQGWYWSDADMDEIRRPCPDCQGTGRGRPYGPALMEATPVEFVRASDREPYLFVDPQFVAWFPERESPDDPNRLPRFLFDALDGHGNDGVGPYSVKWYTSPDLAHASLSRALIGWAKNVS